MTFGFPTRVDEITPAWLSVVLGGPVRSFDATFLEGGVISDAFKLHGIIYDGDAAGLPSSVVVKVSNAVPERREFGVMVNAHVKELNFFRHLAAEVPLRSPRVYGSFADDSEGAENFIIVMEDLTTHSRVFDQVADPPDERYARKIALEAATMHAKFWDSDVTRLPWVGRTDDRYVFSLDNLSKMGSATWGPFSALWRQMFGDDILDPVDDAEVLELTELLCGPKCAGIHEKIYDVLSSRPKTLLHGDLRADNVFRTDPALGHSVDDTTLTYIDWQVLHAGPPGPEFTEAWMHSLTPENRRKDKDMLRQYHDRLVALQPAAAAYTYDMLIEDYSLAYCFWWTAIITLGVGTVPLFDKPERARMRQRWSAGAARSKTAMRDLDCLSLITALAADVPDDPLP